MRDNWVGLLLFGAGILAGVMLVAMLPGMPWSGTIKAEAAPIGTDILDLAAQRSMAAAAWWMVMITGVSALFGAGALVFLYQTLLATQASAKAAQESIITSKANADEVARLTRLQYRAYMTVTEVIVTPDVNDSRNFGFTWKVANTGQSPANNVKLTIWLRAYACADEDWLDLDRESYTRFLASFPASSEKPDDQWYYFGIADDQIDHWHSTPRIEVSGHIHYVDIFGDFQTDSFAFRHTYDNEIDDWSEPFQMERRPELTSALPGFV